MAQRKLNDSFIKPRKQKEVIELKKKLQLQLELDLLRLLHNSSFYDLELVVDSESLFSHSCILKTRAARFYTYITTEFSVIETSVITTVYIENVSIIYIKKFIENVYSPVFLPEAENYVLKYLQNTRKEKLLDRDNFVSQRQKVLSPDTDKFFTPKCSPSELYKPFTLFTTSQEEINLSRSKNNANVRSYYRIVSVDDIQSDHHSELDTSLEKELAEQDALFNSLKCISAKKIKHTSSSRRGRTVWKESREPIKRLPAWRPKVADIDSGLKQRGFQHKNSKPNLVLNPPWQDNSSPEMDISSSTPDSGLDLTTNTQMEASPEFQPFLGETACESPPKPACINESGQSLGKDEIARLDHMERNIKDCEEFLMMEKNAAAQYKECFISAQEKRKNLIETNKTDPDAPHAETLGVVDSGGCSLPALNTPPSSPNTLNGCAPLLDPTSAQECASPPSGNFFIDASSLLDDDEIASPPLSLPANVSMAIKEDNFDARLSEACPLDPALERKQGELIFNTSIPHFSRHEINEPIRSCDPFDSELEQVVPVGITDGNLSSSDRNDSHSLSKSLPFSDFLTDYGRGTSLSRIRDTTNAERNVSNDVSASDISDKSASSFSKVIDIPKRKISVECIPIVSGGASPKDFSNKIHSGSPHLPRRHEQAPIISGGMEPIIDSKPEKMHQPCGKVWVVDVGSGRKPNKLLTRGTSCESEYDGATKDQSLKDKREESGFVDNDTSSPKRKTFPVEKSASFGYFIDFDSKALPEPPIIKSKKHRNDSSNLKKNIFSMFIDIKDESLQAENNDSGAGSLTPKINLEESHETFPGADSDGTESGSGSISSKASSKKPLYMFIEAEPPANKKKLIHSDSPKLDQQSDFDLKHSKSRASRQSVERNVWSSDDKTIEPSGTFKEQSVNQQNCEVAFKKDSTFIIGGINERTSIPNSLDLHTVTEATPPRSPKGEEGDSGVIATEESDDSFVKLSDLDNTRCNPYIEGKDNAKTNSLESSRRRPVVKNAQAGFRMTQSIPEGSWQPKKPSRIPEPERGMSRSIGPANGVAPAHGPARISKSLSRLFPNLTVSTLSLARTHASDISEPSSMMSSMDPSGLEISTSETDVSCHGDGAARLGQDLLRMFLDEISPDVVVEVGGRRMKAHKCILSSRCQYFAAMLSGGWVESAGNVISLQGFSYSAVHFALCHIYSGESEIPESLNIVELATLADMLCLEGLKEVISYTLRNKYCHSFHPPCPVCTVGVLDCLPVALDFGLDDLYRKCLRWTVKYFAKVWPTKTFSNLRKEIIDKCLQYHIAHMTVENVLESLLSIDKVRGSLPSIRWAENVTKALNKLQDASVKFLADHFSSILTSDQFLALGKDAEWSIERLEMSLMVATSKLPPEQACWSHARLHSLLTLASSADPPTEMLWNESFINLLTSLSDQVQSSLIKQAPRAVRSKAWQQMEPELRSFIQEAACLPNESSFPTRRSTSKIITSSNVPSSSLRSSTRASELRQVKLAMTQQTNRNVATNRKQPQTQQSQRNSEVTRPVPPVIKRGEVRKSQSTSAVREVMKQSKGAPARFSEVKSRYLQPRSPHKSIPDKTSVPGRTGAAISSSDSSRNCSPAMTRASFGKTNKPLRKPIVGEKSNSATIRPLSQLAADDNMSTDSLATESSCGEKDVLCRKQGKGKENATDAKRRSEGSQKLMTSLPRKTQSFSSFPSTGGNLNKPKTMIPCIEQDNRIGRRTVVSRVLSGESRTTPDRSNTLSPRLPQRGRAYANAVNGNVHSKTTLVDSQNNTTSSFKPPAFVSRSGTFLKDEPTVLKKPQADQV